MLPNRPHDRFSANDDEKGSSWQAVAQRLGLVLGPCLAVFCYSWLPSAYEDATGQVVEFSSAGRATLSVMVWMAIWWLTEAVELAVTSLLPLVLFPLLGVGSFQQAAAPYAHPLIFLFMGGFLLALSMARWGLDQRIALKTLRGVGTRPRNIVAGFMFVTALLSAFVSNTATAAMMLPIALSVIGLTGGRTIGANNEEESDLTPGIGKNFATCLMLGIAYAASIGGVTTIVGSPPNVFLVSFLGDTIAEPHRCEISFLEWMKVGVPLAIVLLPLAWWLLTYICFPVGAEPISGGQKLIEGAHTALGQPNRGELATFLVFLLTASAWMTRPWLADSVWQFGDTELQPFAGLSDSGIAMTGAMLLFVTPASRQPWHFVLDWNTAKKLPWDILILFGGGLSLAAAVDATGAAQFIGSQTGRLAGVPASWLIVLVCAGVVFLTELTSNVATAAALIPILAAIAPALGLHPYLLVFPAVLSASCAFMLPIATPPNAIVFASGNITIRQMIHAGFWLNLIAIAIISCVSLLVVPSLIGN